MVRKVEPLAAVGVVGGGWEGLDMVSLAGRGSRGVKRTTEGVGRVDMHAPEAGIQDKITRVSKQHEQMRPGRLVPITQPPSITGRFHARRALSSD